MGDENTERLTRLETAVEHIQHDITDIKAMLGQLLPVLIKFTGDIGEIKGDIGEIKGRMAGMPTARDFGRLEGRVAEMSERLPTTIGYTPPKSAAG